MHWGCYYATALDIEVDPQRCCLGSCQSDFALQAVVECRALEKALARMLAAGLGNGDDSATSELLEQARRRVLEPQPARATTRSRSSGLIRKRSMGLQRLSLSVCVGLTSWMHLHVSHERGYSSHHARTRC